MGAVDSEYRTTRSDLDDLPKVHHCDAVGDALDDGDIVRDEQIADLRRRLKIEHEIDDLGLDRDVQRRN